MKKRIIAIAFISILVLATLSNTVFAKESEESFKENILLEKINDISIFKNINFNFFELLNEILEWILLGLGFLYFLPYIFAKILDYLFPEIINEGLFEIIDIITRVLSYTTLLIFNVLWKIIDFFDTIIPLNRRVKV